MYRNAYFVFDDGQIFGSLGVLEGVRVSRPIQEVHVVLGLVRPGE